MGEDGVDAAICPNWKPPRDCKGVKWSIVCHAIVSIILQRLEGVKQHGGVVDSLNTHVSILRPKLIPLMDMAVNVDPRSNRVGVEWDVAQDAPPIAEPIRLHLLKTRLLVLLDLAPIMIT